MKHALTGVLPEELAELAKVDVVDARRILAAVFREGRIPEKATANFRRDALQAVTAMGQVPRLTTVTRQASALDPFVKYAFSGADTQVFETVRIPLHNPARFSVCVSSQVGCALGCRFCATGQMGLIRNLETWEIVEQVRQVRSELPDGTRVHGVVFQGMGEPLSNVDRVIRAIRVLSMPAGLAIDQRNITVSTSGLIPGIRRLASELPNVRLGVSIGDAREGKRAELMPIDATYPLTDVLVAAGEHAKAAGYAPMWAYTLLEGRNDGPDAAGALADRAAWFLERFGVRPRISLIPNNPIDGGDFGRSSDDVQRAFRDVLGARGFGTILRYSGGSDIQAACGQLVTLTGAAARSGKASRGAERSPG